MRILVIRMTGLGDVASILIPATRLLQQQHPEASISALTYGAGCELMALAPGISTILDVTPEHWPDEFDFAVQNFMDIAEFIAAQQFDQIINLDTAFMPCFLARVLKDLKLDLAGNYINLSIHDLFQKLSQRELDQSYFQEPAKYLSSSFPHMADWTIPWWLKYSDTDAYPGFYLNHCCGLKGAIDISLDIEPDLEFYRQSDGKKIIALSTSGSKPSKQYRASNALRLQLEQAGYFVWSQFDGSLPMATTLGRLKVTDMLVTVPTSSQWLAKLVGCPSLMIPGPLPPSVLGAEIVVDQLTSCQYCYQSFCPENRGFDCLDIPPEQIIAKISSFFATNADT